MAGTTQANLQVIFAKRQAHGNIASIQITSEETLGSLIARLMELYFTGSNLGTRMFSLYMAITSQELVVHTTDTASILWLDLEASPRSSRVFVQQLEFDSLLTSACRGTDLLSSSKPFVQLYPRLCGVSGGASASNMLVLSLRFSPSKAVGLFLLITAGALLIGLVCGIWKHNFETGLSIFASISGVMVVLQGFVSSLHTIL